jgi:thiamine biosynthesis protein ThiS
MAIIVNGEPFEWQEGLTIEQIIKEKKFSFPLKTVFINGHKVPKEEENKTEVQDGDEVNIIHLMSGG